MLKIRESLMEEIPMYKYAVGDYSRDELRSQCVCYHTRELLIDN